MIALYSFAFVRAAQRDRASVWYCLTSLFSVCLSYDVLSLYHYFLFAVLLLFSTIAGWILLCKALSSYLVSAMSLTHGALGEELIYILVLFATSMSAVIQCAFLTTLSS
jgi:hypothetical protein